MGRDLTQTFLTVPGANVSRQSRFRGVFRCFQYFRNINVDTRADVCKLTCRKMSSSGANSVTEMVLHVTSFHWFGYLPKPARPAKRGKSIHHFHRTRLPSAPLFDRRMSVERPLLRTAILADLAFLYHS